MDIELEEMVERVGEGGQGAIDVSIGVRRLWFRRKELRRGQVPFSIPK